LREDQSKDAVIQVAVEQVDRHLPNSDVLTHHNSSREREREQDGGAGGLFDMYILERIALLMLTAT